MEMIEVKTADLIGPALDWAVGYSVRPEEFLAGQFAGSQEAWLIDWISASSYSPSTQWEDGGPLIDANVEIIAKQADGKYWSHSGNNLGEGSTALVAACRAIVAAKLGDTVSVPKELMQ